MGNRDGPHQHGAGSRRRLIDAHEDDGEVTGTLLGNDVDADGDELMVTPIDPVLTDGLWTIGQIVVDAAGVYTLTLDEGLQALNDGESVSATFSYEVDDGFGGTTTADVLVAVDRPGRRRGDRRRVLGLGRPSGATDESRQRDRQRRGCRPHRNQRQRRSGRHRRLHRRHGRRCRSSDHLGVCRRGGRPRGRRALRGRRFHIVHLHRDRWLRTATPPRSTS